MEILVALNKHSNAEQVINSYLANDTFRVFGEGIYTNLEAHPEETVEILYRDGKHERYVTTGGPGIAYNGKHHLTTITY